MRLRSILTFLHGLMHSLQQTVAASQSKDAQQNLIDRLIWELVQLCAPQNDSVIQQMAGECLGELGAVDPYAISFSFPHDQATGGEPVATKEQQMKLAKVCNKLQACSSASAQTHSDSARYQSWSS